MLKNCKENQGKRKPGFRCRCIQATCNKQDKSNGVAWMQR